MKKIIFLILHFIFCFFIYTFSNAQWMPISSPFTEKINCLAVSGKNIFAGTSSCGIFISNNNGISWTAINNGLPLKSERLEGDDYVKSFESIVSLVAKGENIYAAKGEQGLSSVLVSQNNGKTWIEKWAAGIGSCHINSIAISGTSIFAAGSYGAFYISTNNGSNWKYIGFNLSKFSNYHLLDINSVFACGKNILVLADRGHKFFLTDDKGMTWKEVKGLLPHKILSFVASGTNIYAGTYSGVYLSENSGINWTSANTGMDKNTNVSSFVVSGKNIFAGTNKGVFLSSNNGKNWEVAGLKNKNIGALAVRDTNIFAAVYNCYVLSNYNKEHTDYNKNPNCFGLYLSSNNGKSWTSVNAGLNNSSVSSITLNEGIIYAEFDKKGVFFSTDYGKNWKAVNSGIEYKKNCFLAMFENNVFASTENGVYFSSNKGKKWIKANIGLLNTIVTSYSIINNNIFVSTLGDGVFLLSKNRKIWKTVNKGLECTYVYSLAVLGTNIYAATDYGVFLSKNKGISWCTVNKGLPDASITSISANGTNIFAATDEGVYLSSNNGTSWSPVNTGLANTIINSLSVNKTDIFIGTKGSGVWKRSLSDIMDLKN